MILLNFFNDHLLCDLRTRMDAPLPKRWKKSQITLIDPEFIRKLGTEGVEIDFGEIKVEQDSTLSLRGQRVVVSIRDVPVYGNDYKLPKYHFSYCRTLSDMTKKNRWGRYHSTQNNSGEFLINFTDNRIKSEIHHLDICQNCLDLLSWDGFSYGMSLKTRESIVKNFNLKQFFEKYPKDVLSVMPTYTVDIGPVNDYTDDWNKISATTKKDRGYKCEQCGIQLPESDKHLLDVHHANGQKNDNSKSNLKVVCVECHSLEEMHSHYRDTSRHKEFQEKYSRK